MFKMVKKIGALIVVLSLLLTGCEIGMGNAIDFDAPVVIIESPKSMENIPTLYTISGKSFDNVGTKRLEVSINDTSMKWVNKSGKWYDYSSGDKVKIDSGTWTKNGKSVTWSLDLNLSSMKQGEYTLKVEAWDKEKNFSADSRDSRTFVLDKTPPKLTIYSPQTSENSSDFNSWLLNDSSLLGKVYNGDINITGKIDDDLFPESMEVELKAANGEILYTSSIKGDLWNFNHTIPESEIRYLGSRITNKTPIEIVTKVNDKAGNLTIQSNGWICYWPDYDKPWNVTPLNSGDELYPETDITGISYDDDGVKSVIVSITSGSTTVIEETFSQGDVKNYLSWALKSPSAPGNYSVSIKSRDLNGVETQSSSVNFTVKDLGMPGITWGFPDTLSPLLGDSSGNFTITGVADDNIDISQAQIAWLEDSSSELAYFDANSSLWTPGVDGNGNKVWDLSLGSKTTGSGGREERAYSINLNLFTHFIVSSKLPSRYVFFIRVTDDEGNAKVFKNVVTGDVVPPVMDITKVIVKKGVTLYEYTSLDGITLPALSPTDEVKVVGTWFDTSVDNWSDKSNFGQITARWNDIDLNINKNLDGTFESDFIVPPKKGSVVISAIGEDITGNKGYKNRSFFIEVDNPILKRISSTNYDGVYNADKEITIILEFNKNVTYSGGIEPTLSLNTSTAGSHSGNGTSIHNFIYTVVAGENVTKLGVNSINLNGGEFKDSSGEAADMTLPTGVNTLDRGKKIAIDTTAPTMDSTISTKSSGHYKEGDKLGFILNFYEAIIATGSGFSIDIPALGGKSAEFVTQLNDSSLLFEYTIANGDNCNTLTLGNLTVAPGSSIKDLAGNSLSPTTVKAITETITVDTTNPLSPLILGIDPGRSYYDSIQFSLDRNGESGTTLEYKINDGPWIPVSSGFNIDITSNGTYEIHSRQIDIAGNISLLTTYSGINIDKGNLISYITSSNDDKVYKLGDPSIEIEVITRKDITVNGTPMLQLNSGGVATFSSGKSTSRKLVFEYSVGNGDVANRLNVTSINLNGGDFRDSLGNSIITWFNTPDSSNNLGARKNIRIIGTPFALVSDPVLNGDGTEITLEFNRNVYRGSGNLEFLMTSEFIAPFTVNETEFNSFSSTIQSWYSEGTNGGSVNTGVFTPDFELKYILKYSSNGDETSLTDAFKAAGKDRAIIPVSSSSVSGFGTTTIKVDLSGGYALPVKGGTYRFTFDSSAFKDELDSNYTFTFKDYTINGVEKPVIRVDKKSESIVNSGGIKAEQPYTTTFKINTRTPGATLEYSKTELIIEPINEIVQGDHGVTAGTLEDRDGSMSTNRPILSLTEPEDPNGFDPNQTLGDGSNRNGYKYWIKAKATKNSAVETADEQAFRSVLIFNDNGFPDCIPGTLDEVVWVRGADVLTGQTLTPGFPLSWDVNQLDKVRLMTELVGNEWIWISWEVSKTAYFTFQWGTLPDTVSEAEKGPLEFYWMKAGRNPFREWYPLYPGEYRNFIRNAEDFNEEATLVPRP